MMIWLNKGKHDNSKVANQSTSTSIREEFMNVWFKLIHITLVLSTYTQHIYYIYLY